MVSKPDGLSNKSTMNKPMSIIPIILAVFIIMFLVMSYITGVNPTGRAIAEADNCKDIQVPYEEQEAYMKTEYYVDTVPYTDRECENKNLVYKMDRGTCSNRQSGILGLGDQPAKYSCTITNLDSEAGTFSVEIGFNIGTQQLKTLQNEYIYPQSSKTFSYSSDTKIDSCFCVEKSIPTKQVCRDVIKYQDVQKERQVTAYRSVTKYRTEQQCN